MDDKTAIALIQDPIIKNLIKSCDEDYMQMTELTPKEIQILKKYAVLIKFGDHAMIPMICTAERCICRCRCPLLAMKKVPLGKECPFERFAFNEWEVDYKEALDVDGTNKVERELVRDLVESDILNARANVVLGEEGFMMENPIGIDENTGEPITRREEHIALRLKDRAQNRKDKVYKSFLATREQKLKSLAALKRDPTEIMAELRSRGKDVEEHHQNYIEAEAADKPDKKTEKKVEEKKNGKGTVSKDLF